MSKGTLFVISGPSGSGKDTVLSKVFEKCPELKFSISVITRAMRPGETPDGKYRFVSREQFESMIEHDELLEHNVFVGNYYGTPKAPVIEHLENGDDVIVEVDVNGAKQITQKMPEAVSIFILPPSLEILKNRLAGRGTETKENLEKRLNESLREIKCSKTYDYIVVNDNLDDAVEDFITVIKSSRLKAVNNLNKVDNIIKL